jgi:hypothetical protein
MAYCGQRGRVLKGGSTSPRPCNRNEPDSAAAGVRGMKRDHEEQPDVFSSAPFNYLVPDLSLWGSDLIFH